MKRMAACGRTIIAAAILLGLLNVHAQSKLFAQPADNPSLPAFQLPGDLALPGAGEQDDEPKFVSQFQLKQGSREGRLTFTLKLPPEWHVYSLTQKPGGPLKSKIKVESVAGVEITGEFLPNRDPKIHHYRDIYGDLPVEEHDGEVVWMAPIRLDDNVKPEELTIVGRYDGLRCRGGALGQCIPVSHRFTAKFAGYFEAAATGEFRAPNSAVKIRGVIEPQSVPPGGLARLTLEAIPDEGFHIYAVAARPSDNLLANKPTLIVVSKSSGLTHAAPVASKEPVVAPATDAQLPEQRYHEGAVRWTVELRVPEDIAPGPRNIAGQIGYQVCTDTSCQPPVAAAFEGTLEVGPAGPTGEAPLAFVSSKYAEVAKLATSAPQAPGATGQNSELASVKTYAPLSMGALWIKIGSALLGGLILNLMPCVLPVIGLKVLSFAQQGGESRGRVLGLNLSFSLGLLSVFLVLATLAAFAQLGWGEQFTNLWFKVGITGLVFAMALSFLGVWEMPIPGFTGGRNAQDLQEREGLDGAFFKGAFTTLLATPCSGPFLGTVFGFTLTQPPWVTYVIFLSVGVGMASPYLLLGAFPSLMRFLPRPGAWMETFKEVMGFVLLGTVVFLFSTINKDYFIPTLTLLVGIWFACWWIGRTAYTQTPAQRATAWLGSIATATAIGVLAFTFLAPGKEALPWQPWSPSALAQAQAEGKTVMVDFTADWCLTCKTNLKFAINTKDVRNVVDQHGIQPLLADWTDESEEIKKALEQLGSKSIPLLAIYPADRPNDPIVLRDLLSESDVIEALKQAGPSKSAQTRTAKAGLTLSDAR
jgi:thiol:disulfide interchange protein